LALGEWMPLGWPATPFGMAGHPLYSFFFLFFFYFCLFYFDLNLFLKNNKILVSGLPTQHLWETDGDLIAL
jgi:hypothetical protein